MVSPANSTLAYIRNKVRRLTASASESALTTALIDEYINNFYTQDFAYAIKIDQMRNVYTFYTAPNIDRYPLDVNYNQGVRSPAFVDGIPASFFKDRQQFFNMWPKWPTLFQPVSGDGITTLFNFTLPAPFLSQMVTIGCVSTGGAAIQISDDGNGNLQLNFPNPIVTIPAPVTTYPAAIPPVPGMHNTNTLNPGLNAKVNIGTVNYVTGAFSINFTSNGVTGIIPASGETLKVFVSQYSTGRPYSLLFWNNEFTIRPIPKFVHKIEVETYLTPVQFMQTTDNPILNQWAKYIAMGAARDILNDRQDMDGVANVSVMFKEQEALVLERQGVEEIGQRNSTIYNGNNAQPYQNWGNNGVGWY
jgi:hypothetical protein